SVSKDWEHWVALHGSEEVARENVKGMGRVIGVKFNGVDNMFQVLSKERRGRLKAQGVGVGEGGGKA
ncbi:endonuclease/exonuclease/phosphatase family protein, partial [Trifolium medium]|nr:endonuclease/exonuclease/phosphatase family protein [Trifolium medium]